MYVNVNAINKMSDVLDRLRS